MATEKQNNKTTPKTTKSKNGKGLGIALLWAVFAVHQGFLSWLVLTNFNNYIAVAAALMSFGLAILAVAMVGAKLSKTYSK